MDLKKIFLRYGLLGKKSIYLYNGIKVQGGFRMKKISKYIIAAVTAAVFMLSACSKTDGGTAETTSEASAAASSEAVQEKTEATASETSAETTSVTETAPVLSGKMEEYYNALDVKRREDLEAAAGTLEELHKAEGDGSVPYSESLSKAFYDFCAGSEGFYIKMKSDNTAIEAAAETGRIKLAVCMPSAASMLFIDGNVIHSYSPADLIGYKKTISDEEAELYGSKMVLDSAILFPEEGAEAKKVNISCGGEDYICEVFDGFAYIFDENSMPVMLYDSDTVFTVEIETGDIDDSVFDLPEGYVVADFDEKTEETGETEASE